MASLGHRGHESRAPSYIAIFAQYSYAAATVTVSDLELAEIIDDGVSDSDPDYAKPT